MIGLAAAKTTYSSARLALHQLFLGYIENCYRRTRLYHQFD